MRCLHELWAWLTHQVLAVASFNFYTPFTHQLRLLPLPTHPPAAPYAQQAASGGGCGCSGGSSSAAARGEQASAAAANHQLNGMMGSMEQGLSRDEIMDAWEASGPRQASRAAELAGAGCQSVVLRVL